MKDRIFLYPVNPEKSCSSCPWFVFDARLLKSFAKKAETRDRIDRIKQDLQGERQDDKRH
jgi:hypothetical protein